MIGGVMMQFDFWAWIAGIPDWILGVLQWIYGIFSYVFHWIFNVFTWIWTTIFIPENFMFLFRALIFPGLIFVVMALIWAVWFTRKLCRIYI